MRFTSHDVESVEHTWKQFVPSASLNRADPARFRFDWRSEQMSRTALVRYTLAAQVSSTAAPEDQILVCRVDAPDALVREGRHDLDPTRPWISDGRSVHATWGETAIVRAFVFDREHAQETARRLSGDDRLALEVLAPAPVDAAAAARWEETFDYLDRTLAGLDDDDELLRAALERHALRVTLGCFGTTLGDSLRRTAQARPAPAVVRRALIFIEENAHRPITVDDVAAAVHMSTRGLQYAFRRALDSTPAEHLRRARLDGAHRELRGGSADTVAAVARRWGFSHPSRFAAAYRRAYGQPPGALRREA